MTQNSQSQFSPPSNSDSSRTSGQRTYRETGSGTNGLGNRWDTRDYGTGPEEEAYHHSNKDGSWYYQNADGSKYFNDGRGNASYTPPGKE